MYKKTALFFLFFIVLSSLKAAPITMLTSKLVMENNVTQTTGGVSIFNMDMYIHADEAIFLENSKKLELIGNIIVKRGGKTEGIFEYLTLDLETNSWFADNMAFPKTENGIWIMADGGANRKEGYTLASMTSSSCSIDDPDWTIKSTTSDYSKEKQWVSLYNPIFYAGQVPVFYMPYFGYSTDSRRRSGLLPPVIGKSNKEGWIYEQPVYFAPHESFDLEFNPQIREKRGSGMSGKLRFADSPNSNGYIVYGKFTDNNEFQEEYNLKEKEHSGVRTEYNKGRIFSSDSDSIDGLYFKWEDYSDVDYIKLETAKERGRSISQIITNELHYYYANYDYYFGLRGKYFKDILDPERKDLLQHYPIIEAHSFADQFLLKKLTYSADLNSKSYKREEGISADEIRVKVPIGFHDALFNDYLSYKLSHNIDYYKIDYKNGEDSLDEDYGSRVNTYSRIGFLTNLTKRISEGYHNFNIALGYTVPGDIEEEGVFEDEFATFSKEREGYDLKFSQYLYDDRYSMYFSQRVNQNYIKQDDNNWSLEDLEHEITIKPYSWMAFKNLFKYSHENDVVYSTSSGLSMKGSRGSLSLSYLTGKDQLTKEANKEYYTVKASTALDSRNKMSGSYQYDKLANDARVIGLSYWHGKKCWGVSLSFTRNISPITTTTGTSSRINDTIFLKLNINPLGTQQWMVYEEEKGTED